MILRNIRLVIVGYFLVLCLTIPVRALGNSDLDNPKIIEAFVDGLVIPLMKNHQSPSGTVSIVKAGKLIFSKGYGFQNIEKNIGVEADKTLFRTGSVSKLLTWVSVMQMVEQGKLDLDGDVNAYLKTFQIKDTFPGQPITMRHIMTHTAGFEDGSVGYLISDDPARIMPLAHSMKRYQPERVNPPGKQAAYSNYGAALAGLIVANLSGVEFADYVQKNILDVLGMESSSFEEPLPRHMSENAAVAYAREGGAYIAKPFEIISNFAPAGALSATSTDMVKFAQAILNGGEYKGARILEAETVKQMLSHNFSQDDRLMGLALGFYEVERNGLRLMGHEGDTHYFHSDLVIDKKNEIALFVSFSAAGGYTVRSAFTGSFYDVFYPAVIEKITAPTDFGDRSGKYAGNYLLWRSSFSKIDKAMGILGGAISVQPTADNTLVVDLWGKASHYVEIDNNLFRKVDGPEKIAFQENDHGEIIGFIMDSYPAMSTYKAPFYRASGYQNSLLGLSILVFIGVMLRLAYRWDGFRALSGEEKKAAKASVIAAGVNLAALSLLGVVLVTVGDKMFSEIQVLFKVWLIMPFLVVLAGIYHMYQMVLVWKIGLYNGIWTRIRYSLITFSAMFMAWFYYFWNLLGFHYFS
ncbi:serine hydrolase domain-containing protein [Paremcibacter congregatus]|nr:serine hydrolase domain-containing protein [Paremcibacter congregatus]